MTTTTQQPSTHLIGYRLVSWQDHSEAAIKASIRELVNVYEGRGNEIGTQERKEQPLASSWFKRADAATLERLRANTVTFFKNHAKTRSRENAWTTFKPRRTKLKGAAHSGPGCWLPLNTKATNAFAHKRSMAYLANRFSLPVLRNFFTKRGIEVKDNLFAISEMIQVLWRTAIRNGEPVHLYIPSERMRPVQGVASCRQHDRTLQATSAPPREACSIAKALAQVAGVLPSSVTRFSCFGSGLFPCLFIKTQCVFTCFLGPDLTSRFLAMDVRNNASHNDLTVPKLERLSQLLKATATRVLVA